VTLPAIGLTRGRRLAFAWGCARSYRAAKRVFALRPPQAVLAMGGFTAAPPVLAGRKLGARTYLHESNTIPGRANRWLAWVVDRAFVGFPSTVNRLHNRAVTVTGTPVRPQFVPRDPATCRSALGLDPARPVVLVMGGSQGARGINELVIRALPLLAQLAPEWQWLHLTGPGDFDKVRRAYAGLAVSAVVRPFVAEMELAMGAALVAVSRAGASSLAELAALRLPAVLVPYPAAANNHQYHNARVFENSGAARLLEQRGATPGLLARLLTELDRNQAAYAQMRQALAQWHAPRAAADIAEAILADLAPGGKPAPPREPDAQLKGRPAGSAGGGCVPGTEPGQPAGRVTARSTGFDFEARPERVADTTRKPAERKGNPTGAAAGRVALAVPATACASAEPERRGA
jgi:UDP-N-acetylglucosamine--N-acetylmuramyl-(pentapeptide) pyrophosphoryl-undecaprenol N-acetylglucosamine transferase